MKKIILFSALSLILFSCNSNNSINVPSIDGSLFFRTNYVIETPIDINGDGVFSTDILAEQSCSADGMSFNPGEKVTNPTFDGIGLEVTTDGNGNQIQVISCGIGDGYLPSYAQIDDEVHLLYGEEIDLIGELSADGNKITFRIPNEKLYALELSGNDILNPGGSITEYQGGAIVTYTRD